MKKLLSRNGKEKAVIGGKLDEGVREELRHLYSVKADIGREVNEGLWEELRHLYSVMELSQLIGQGKVGEEVAWLVVTAIPSLLKVPFAAMGLKEAEDGKWLVVGQRHKRHLDAAIAQEIASLLTAGLASRVFSSIAFLLPADFPGAPVPVPEPLAKMGLKSVLVAPVRTVAHEFGVLIVGSEVGENYTSHQRFLIGSLANQVAVALENARLIEQARELEERYRSTLDSMLEGCHIISYDWRFLYVNDAAARHCRQAKEELLGHTIMERYPGIEHTEAFAFLRRCMEERIPHYMESELMLSDGSKGWFEFSIQPVPQGIFVLSEDITERKRAEEALQQSEQKLRITLESIADGVAVTDLGLNIVGVNQAGLRMFGYSHKQELIGRNGLELVSVKDHARALEDMSRTIQTGRSGTLEYTFVAKGGREFTAEYDVAVVRDTFGNPVGFVSTMRDITERKQAEEALRESEHKYRVLFDSTLDGVCVIDAETMKVVLGNEAAAKIYGWDSVGDMVGANLLDFVPPDERERVIRIITEDMFEKNLRQVNEFRTITKDGREIWISAVGVRTEYQGRLAGLISFRDITERKRAEEFSRELFDSSAIGMYIAQEGRFQLVNPEFQRLTGYTKDELLGMDSLSLVVPQDKNMVRENAVKTLRGERSSPYEFRCVNKRGEIRWVMEKVTAIEYKGRPATLGNFMDITERKQAEQELKRSWEKPRRVLEETVDALASLVEKRDPYTAGHQRRVTKLACAIAREIGLYEEQIDGIRVAGAIHDVGKMYVPTGILSKPGKLTDYEFAIIKTHPQVGYEIVKGIEFPWPVAQAILQHHERLDGSGYPAGLPGEESILEARILAVSDVVEAMSSHRPFRPALGTDKALEEVSQNSGILYDPDVVDACLKLFNEKGFSFE